MKNKKRHLGWKIVLIVIAVLVVVIVGGGISMFGPIIKAANSIEVMQDDVYFMQYEGDYGFASMLEKGGVASDAAVADYVANFLSHGFYKPELQEGNYGCSTVSVQSDMESPLFGRNFDWQDCKAMVVKTNPKDGYQSISTCNLDFLGFEEDWIPNEGMMNKIMSLAALYVPLDGMNEKGLCVADLVIDDGTVTNQDTEKPDITTTTAIRLLLDQAATVDEAVALLTKYDMHSSAGMQHHFAISDIDGNSIVVEYIENQMFVTETDIVTNFYLTEGDHFGIGSKQSQHRYETIEVILGDCGGKMSEVELMETLEAVSQKNYNSDYEATQWSIVFHKEALMAEYCFKENYEKSYIVSLMDGKEGTTWK